MGPGSRFAWPGRRKYFRAAKSAALIQPAHNLVERFEITVADVHGSAGISVIDADSEPELVAEALFQRDRIRVLCLAASRLLRFARLHALDSRQRLLLTHVDALLHDAFVV